MSLHLPAPAEESAGPGGSATTAEPLPQAAPGQSAATDKPTAAAGGGRAKGRLRALDGLRLIAALMVCVYHYGGREGDIATAWGRSPSHIFPHLAGPFSYGPLGVQIFFVISGFVISMSGWGRSVKDFAISRITRLYPAYWAALVIITVAFAIVGLKRVSDTDLLVNFTMLQMPAGAERVLGVCWTLWAEMRFYLLFALFVVWPGATRKRVLVFCTVWTVGALYAESAGQDFLKLALMPEYAPFFVAGMGLYLVYRFGHDALAWGVVAVGFLLGQREEVKALVAPPHMHVFHHRSQLMVIAVVAFGFLAVIAVTLVPRIANLNWRWLTTAGALTYPFYLVHEHLGWVVIGKLNEHTSLSPGAIFVSTVLFMLVLAYVLYRVVEKPLAPRLKRLLQRQPVLR
ncbi:acyltransferase family protein [Actinacidiphila sp. ITFR-21]|uniref:acyltransferase family protein n=1 Tax=Actinacidiphila sp. ITFR-21 TaxID=3075199 RepID=UPI00288A7B6F|nr:acyltransferase [Streptomyces sp. ITFR-21]WNI17398.1 acyltransferase [Streptomyces sp. ITFR-21]